MRSTGVAAPSAIIGAARAGLLVAKAPDNPEHERILASTKSNLGAPMPSWRYRLVAPLKDVEGLEEDDQEHLRNVPVVEWLGESALSATALLNTTPASEVEAAPGRLEEATEWLRETLADGPIPANDLERAARAVGIAHRTFRRASDDLDVAKQKVGYGRGARTLWSLPSTVPGEDDELDESNLSNNAKVVQPLGMDRFDTDGQVWRAGENMSPCPVTGAAHEYALMRDAHGRLLCVECGEPHP